MFALHACLANRESYRFQLRVCLTCKRRAIARSKFKVVDSKRVGEPERSAKGKDWLLGKDLDDPRP